MRTISLVGMPGGGKSTVGRQLGRQLGLPFVDSDAEIERQIGGTIRAFFEREGEERFREIETQVLGALTQPDRPPCVLATGGGAVLRKENRDVLRRNTTVFYLRSTPEELFKRLRHDTQRPLLQVPDPLRKLRELFATRDPLYRGVAHYVMETGRPSVAAQVNMLLMQLELGGLIDPHRGLDVQDEAKATVQPAADAAL